MKNYFITGTDTGVGKTFVTVALMNQLQARGVKVAPMKPVAAGTIDIDGAQLNEDVAMMQANTKQRFALRDVNPYCMNESIAPHIAAANENVTLDPQVIYAAFSRLAKQSDCVLVEGAGGFLVPLNASTSMADLPTLLKLDVILVVGMRLGCLNHALLTAEAIRARGYNLAGWIANTLTVEPMGRLEENIASLKLLMKAPLLGTVPHLDASEEMNGRLESAAAHLQIDTLL